MGHDARSNEQWNTVEVLPEQGVDLNLDCILVSLFQGDLELRGQLVDLSVGVTAEVSATGRAEDLRNAGNADSR